MPPLTPEAELPCRDVLPPLVRSTITRLARAVAELTSESPSEAWHEARLHAKRARYAADAVVPILGRRFEDLAIALEQVTESLGEHQDACMSGALIERIVDRPGVDPRSAYALGLVRAEESAREKQARAEFPSLWRTVVKAARRADVLSGKAAALA
jgi:CHAD domain-containing protein